MVQEAGRSSWQEWWQKDEGIRAAGDGACGDQIGAWLSCQAGCSLTPALTSSALLPEIGSSWAGVALGWGFQQGVAGAGPVSVGFLLAEEEAGGLVAAPIGSAESTPACRASWPGIP